jgi:hypothetical protein
LNTYQWKAVSPSGDIHYQGNPVTMFFGDPSLHTIHYRITDHFGCSDTMTEEINVLPAPVCAFDFVTGEGMTDGTVHFRNNTTGATSYAWDFGNGEVSELAEPVTSYNTEGNYLVRLIAVSNEGCYDTTAQSYDYFPDCWFPNAFKPDYDGVNDIFRPGLSVRPSNLMNYQFSTHGGKWYSEVPTLHRAGMEHLRETMRFRRIPFCGSVPDIRGSRSRTGEKNRYRDLNSLIFCNLPYVFRQRKLKFLMGISFCCISFLKRIALNNIFAIQFLFYGLRQPSCFP